MSISITDSVGRGGKNRKADTRKIQRALNQVTGGAALAVDGDCGPKTISRIETFQRGFMARPDGRVDPGGRSLRRLNQMLDAAPVKKARNKTVKSAAKKSVKKSTAKKTAKGAVKKSAAKSAPKKTGKSAAKKTARKTAAKKTVKKAAAKSAPKKSAAKSATAAATAAAKASARAAVKSSVKKTAKKAVKKSAGKAVKKAAKKSAAAKRRVITISASVGRDGKNLESDVRLVQEALNEVIPQKPLKVDGKIGAKTIAKIEQFQSGFMQKPDGRIDPGGKSIKRLSGSAPAMQGAWKGDSSRWSEAKKLDSLDKDLRKKVERVLDNLKGEGFKPKIVYAWRSVEVQRQLVAQGHSKVRFSFHNAQYKNGRPRAYAADIIDRRWAWSDAAMDNGFWAALGRIAKAEGLFWGGDWRSFKDWAHVQAHPNSRLAEIRRQSGVA